MIRRSHLFAMSNLGDNSVTAVTIGHDSHDSLSPSRARMCVIKNLTPTRIESSSSSVTNSHHIVTMSLSHIREKDVVTNAPTLLARFKQQLKKGPRLPRKQRAEFVMREARKQGLCSG